MKKKCKRGKKHEKKHENDLLHAPEAVEAISENPGKNKRSKEKTLILRRKRAERENERERFF